MADLSWINTLIGVSGTLISGGLVQYYHAHKDRRERNDKRLAALNHYARALQDIADKAELGEYQFGLQTEFGSTLEMLEARKEAYPFLSELEGKSGYNDLISPAVLLAEDTYLAPSNRAVNYGAIAKNLRDHISANPKPPKRKTKKK